MSGSGKNSAPQQPSYMGQRYADALAAGKVPYPTPTGQPATSAASTGSATAPANTGAGNTAYTGTVLGQ